MAAKRGMGFKAAARSVAKMHNLPIKQAQAIIAAGAQKASPAAKKKNPNLQKVAAKGTKKTSGGTFSKRQRSSVTSKRQRSGGR